jgi:hypothetical protein
MKTCLNKLAISAAALATLAGFSGCASFPNNEVGSQTRTFAFAPQNDVKATAYVECRFYRGKPPNSFEMREGENLVRTVVDNALLQSGLFAKHSFAQHDQNAADYTLNVKVYNYGSEGLAVFAGFVTGITLGIIPTCATDNYALELSLTKNKTLVSSKFINKDSITTWVGIWLLPAIGNTPLKAVNTTWENQLKAALRDLAYSGQLR